MTTTTSATADLAPNPESVRRMKIVDALKPTDRAKVWEMGLSDFSMRHPVAYRKAKRSARVFGACKRVQRAFAVPKVQSLTA